MAKAVNIHIGNKIKAVLENSPMSVTDFAEKVNRTRAVVYDIFKRNSIDTALLQKISMVLDYDFFAFYSTEIFETVNEERAKYITKISELEKQNKLLEKINVLLEDKHKGK